MSFSVITSFIFVFFFFFFNDTATTEIYTLSLHDALPICGAPTCSPSVTTRARSMTFSSSRTLPGHSCSISALIRSEEHTSELQSLAYLVCRLLLEKKKKKNKQTISHRNINTQILLY